MKLCLLDRDGVVVVNRPTNTKTPADLELIERVPEAIATLNRAGYTVAICTNQAEIGRGILSPAHVRRVHDALIAMLRARGAVVARVYCCGSLAKSPFKKPAGGMLRDAMKQFGASPRTTFFVGDQKADLQAAFHARCRGILVRTGMGRKTLAGPSRLSRAGGNGGRSLRGRHHGAGHAGARAVSYLARSCAIVRCCWRCGSVLLANALRSALSPPLP